MNKRIIGFFSGIGIFALIYLLPLNGLEQAGHTCLALTLLTVVWWASQVAQSGYIGGIYLVLMIIMGVAEPSLVFKSWTGSTLWLVIGAYLIAGAVKDSGLGERIAYAYIIRFVRTYNGIIISIFILTFIMSLLIPHPWPRALLLMSVLRVVARSARMPHEDFVKIGFTAFAASCPVSMIFLTGDATINPLAVANSGMDCSFWEWFIYMSVPMITASLLTMLLILERFKASKKITINLEEVKQKQKYLGSMSKTEKKITLWLGLAILLWVTDSIHGINIGWITLAISLFMSLPLLGDILTPESWRGVPVQVLVFMTAAIAIGTVGNATGMNVWIANTILPANIPSNIYVLSIIIASVTIVVHMFMGSVVAGMGVCIPAFVAFTAGSGISPLAISLMVFSAINIHYILPFHNMSVLVGCEPDTGGYSQKEVIRMGIPLTVVVFIVVLVEAFWFQVTGLI